MIAARAFPLLDVLPASLEGVVLDCEWDRRRLWRLPLPVSSMDVRSLAWHLRLPLWAHEGEPFAVSPAQVLRAPAMFPEQHMRMMGADLACPIDLLDRAEGPTILDGVHRLAKAWVLGAPEVQTRLLPPAMLPRITV